MAGNILEKNDIRLPEDRIIDTDGFCLEIQNLNVDILATDVLALDANGCLVITSAGGGGGATNFLQLTDTPASYAGAGNFLLRVNAGETDVEFVDPNLLLVNFYNSNGVLTSPRFVDGGGNGLFYTNLDDYSVTNGVGQFTIDNIGNLSLTSVSPAGGIQLIANNGSDVTLTTLGLGEIEFDDFPETRDDTGVDPPINFLYTEANGYLRSAPLSFLGTPEIRSDQLSLALNNETGTVAFSSAMPNTDYSIQLTLYNDVDLAPTVLAAIGTNKTVNGFDYAISAPVPTANYELHWTVIENL